MFLGLNSKQKKQLEFEVIADATRIKLTRVIRQRTQPVDSESHIQIIWMNQIVNIARQNLGKTIYVLDTDDEYYYPQENAWHFGEIELVFQRPDTITLIETIIDILNIGMIDIETVNEIFKSDNSKIQFYEGKKGNYDIRIEDLSDIPDEDFNSEHPNIRRLVERMDVLLEVKDFPGVLHSAASIFEVLAKDIIRNPSLENKTLASFFDSFRSKSNLPENVLDTIQNIFRRRNTEPLAGHGQTTQPSINEQEAIILAEMTKSFIRMERKLSETELNL